MVNASLKKEFCVCKPILNGCSFLSNDYLIRLFNSNKSSLVYKICTPFHIFFNERCNFCDFKYSYLNINYMIKYATNKELDLIKLPVFIELN